MKPRITRKIFNEMLDLAHDEHRIEHTEPGFSISVKKEPKGEIVLIVKNKELEPDKMRQAWSSIAAAFPYRLQNLESYIGATRDPENEHADLYIPPKGDATTIVFIPPLKPKQSPGPKKQGLVSFHLLIPEKIAGYLKILRQNGIPTNQVINDAIAFWLQSNTYKFDPKIVSEILGDIKTFL